MKHQTVDPAVLSIRCTHRTSGGRRCRLSVSGPNSTFCPQHRAEQLEEEAADHFPYLSHNYQCFQTAQGINHSLHSLYSLLAENRISPRRAAVLSYISSLLLRTLPQIDADKAAGIIFRPKPVPINVPLAVPVEDARAEEGGESDEAGQNAPENETDAEAQEANIDPGPDSHPGSHADLDTDADTDEEPGLDPGYKSYWDTAFPKLDPKKKPS